eukprot:CAMPEP_0182861686 /NCGR_PEP_ID=MMETSP0034_2-20130328/5634_1 /TAXON_ID=156128 /ORGANISM="Nephroselmis pyriformis, Strain CCMP717" /LENGTH=596 /DNA_ID=CAMNT_0024993643 /DNA_START=36 /DNA_END=1826 /DNA_ORIENTATION=+
MPLDVLPTDFIDGPMTLVNNFRSEIGPFFQLFFDNLSTLLGVLFALTGNLGDFFVGDDTLDKIVWGKIGAGLGISLLWGNFYYAFQASRLTRVKGRQYTAQPYGINTPAAFAFVFSIIIPVFFDQLNKDKPPSECVTIAYSVALAANFIVGILNIIVGFVGPEVIKFVPPASLLVPIAGIGFAFLAIGQVVCNFAQPIVGFLPILFVFIGWGAKVKIGGFVPEAFTVIAVGTIVAWIDPVMRDPTGSGLSDKLKAAKDILKEYSPAPESFAEVGDGFDNVDSYLGTVFPIAISASCLTLMCLLSARNAGDPFPIRETMIVDGVGTLLASLLGCPFGTVVYIGHPAHKRNGATTGYSFLNGVVYFILGLSGVMVIFQAIFPCQAIGPIILFVGLMICEEAVSVLPQRHWAVVFFGLFPSICDWLTNDVPVGAISGDKAWGIYSLKRGAMLISFFWCAILTYVVDRKWWHAAGWSILTAFVASMGIIHMPVAGYTAEYMVDGKSVKQFEMGTWGPFIPGAGDQPCFGDECGAKQWRFFVAYLMVAGVCLLFGGAQKMGYGPPPETETADTLNFQADWEDVEGLEESRSGKKTTSVTDM